MLITCVASMFCKSCNCNSSIATRVGFAVSTTTPLAETVLFADEGLQMIFCLNSMLAWLMKSPVIIEQIEKLSHGYLKMDCEGDKCYGVLAVRVPHS